MSYLEKYLIGLALNDKIYSLSVIDDSEKHFLTVSDKKFKNKEVIKENIEIKVSGFFVDAIEENNNSTFPPRAINTDSKNVYALIVEYLKECLKELEINFNEAFFDFAGSKDKSTFKYEISRDKSLFIKAEIDGVVIY